MTDLAQHSHENLSRVFLDLDIMTETHVGRVGTTYLVQVKNGKATFALKVLNSQNLSSSDMRIQFENEEKALSLLEHSSFLTVVKSGEKGGLPFMLLEHFPGENLFEVFKKKKMTACESTILVGKVCDALASMHSKGMVHFGIKPSNIVVNTAGEIKILQLGQVRFSGGHGEYSHIYITPGYSAPEVEPDGSGISFQADIYSCGCLLYELLTAHEPNGVLILPEGNESFQKLNQIITKATHEEPHLRYENVDHMRDDLNHIAESLARVRCDDSANAGRTSSRKRGSITLLILCLILFSLLFYLGDKYQEDLSGVYKDFISKENRVVVDSFEDHDGSTEVESEVKKGWVKDSHLTKEVRANLLEVAKSKVIQETVQGVRYFLILPEGEVKGVLVDIPWDFDRTSMAEQFVNFSYVRNAVSKGYAVLGWESPARNWTEGSDYGLDDYKLSKSQAYQRRKRWNKWLPKIDEGITQICHKYKLPQNGFIARVDCLSAIRISRYIDIYSARFSVVVYDKPHGLNEPHKDANHILSVFVSPRESYYESSAQHFFLRAKALGYPVLYQGMNVGSNIKKNDAIGILFDYVYQVYAEFDYKDSLTGKQVQLLANRFRSDIASAAYVQDCMNGGLYSVAEASWLPEEQLVRIPTTELAVVWEKGVPSLDTAISETLSKFDVGEYKSLSGKCLSIKSLTGHPFEVHRKGNGNKTIHLPGGKKCDVELEIVENDDYKLLSFRAERWTSSCPLSFKVSVWVQGKWIESFVGDTLVKTGNMPTLVKIPLPLNCMKIRIESFADRGGVQLDDFLLRSL